GTKTQHKQGSANRENVTALVTICAEGTVLQPTIIFKHKNLQFACSPYGWTDSELTMKWMVDDFDAQTCNKAAGRVCTLFLNGNSLHYTLDLLTYVQEQNIIILGHPPHCTHAFQGLDVVFFAHMKEAWTEAIETFGLANDCGLDKSDFAAVFGAVKSAFQKTGIYSFNPSIITEAQMKPTLQT
ncbi:hypothetical protein M422DRAFT_137152, partial [Sphaerobolus stellatus SS14]